jgi:hypothetical protein
VPSVSLRLNHRSRLLRLDCFPPLPISVESLLLSPLREQLCEKVAPLVVMRMFGEGQREGRASGGSRSRWMVYVRLLSLGQARPVLCAKSLETTGRNRGASPCFHSFFWMGVSMTKVMQRYGFL